MEIRESTINDYINFNPSKANIAELRVFTNAPIKECMMIMWNYSIKRYTVAHQGNVICMFGIGEDNAFWTFFSELNNIPLSFYKLAKEKIVGKPFHGTIYTKNTFAVKLIKFLGYEVSEPFPLGNNKEPFVNFYRKECQKCV